jgi:hypothetical protein
MNLLSAVIQTDPDYVVSRCPGVQVTGHEPVTTKGSSRSCR